MNDSNRDVNINAEVRPWLQDPTVLAVYDGDRYRHLIVPPRSDDLVGVPGEVLEWGVVPEHRLFR